MIFKSCRACGAEASGNRAVRCKKCGHAFSAKRKPGRPPATHQGDIELNAAVDRMLAPPPAKIDPLARFQVDPTADGGLAFSWPDARIAFDLTPGERAIVKAAA